MGSRLTDSRQYAHLWGTQEMAEIFDEAGLPPGVADVVIGRALGHRQHPQRLLVCQVSRNDSHRQVIHENLQIESQTGGPMSGKEWATGPLLFQGDHGAVAYRNITITPAEPAK